MMQYSEPNRLQAMQIALLHNPNSRPPSYSFSPHYAYCTVYGGDGHATKHSGRRAVRPACVPENGRKVAAIQTSRRSEEQQPSRRPGRPDRERCASLLAIIAPLGLAQCCVHHHPGFVPIAGGPPIPGSDDGDNSGRAFAVLLYTHCRSTVLY